MAKLAFTTRRPIHGLRALGYLVALLIVVSGAHSTAHAGIDLVRIEGVLGVANTPGSVAQLTLAVGAKSVPLSVSSAQRISGMPASAPEIFSALGPGPPPIRVEGRDEATRKLTGAAAGTPVTITGNLDAGNAFLTLMEVDVGKSAGAE